MAGSDGVEAARCDHGNVASCSWCIVRRQSAELLALREAVRAYADARPCHCAAIAGGHCESCRCFGEMMVELERDLFPERAE